MWVAEVLMEVDVCVTLFVLDVQCALFAADTRWKNVWKDVNIFILIRLNVSESMLIAKKCASIFANYEKNPVVRLFITYRQANVCLFCSASTEYNTVV
jgi:hypothetical protein